MRPSYLHTDIERRVSYVLLYVSTFYPSSIEFHQNTLGIHLMIISQHPESNFYLVYVRWLNTYLVFHSTNVKNCNNSTSKGRRNNVEGLVIFNQLPRINWIRLFPVEIEKYYLYWFYNIMISFFVIIPTISMPSDRIYISGTKKLGLL